MTRHGPDTICMRPACPVCDERTRAMMARNANAIRAERILRPALSPNETERSRMLRTFPELDSREVGALQVENSLLGTARVRVITWRADDAQWEAERRATQRALSG